MKGASKQEGDEVAPVVVVAGALAELALVTLVEPFEEGAGVQERLSSPSTLSRHFANWKCKHFRAVLGASMPWLGTNKHGKRSQHGGGV